MEPRYYNIKIGSPNINGFIVQVDANAYPLDERVKDFFNSDTKDDKLYLRFHHVRTGSGAEVYDMVTPYSIGKGPSFALQIGITPNGNLHYYGGHDEVHIKEISEEEAKKSKQNANYWELMQGYMGM